MCIRSPTLTVVLLFIIYRQTNKRLRFRVWCMVRAVKYSITCLRARFVLFVMFYRCVDEFGADSVAGSKLYLLRFWWCLEWTEVRVGSLVLVCSCWWWWWWWYLGEKGIGTGGMDCTGTSRDVSMSRCREREETKTNQNYMYTTHRVVLVAAAVGSLGLVVNFTGETYVYIARKQHRTEHHFFCVMWVHNTLSKSTR